MALRSTLFYPVISNTHSPAATSPTLPFHGSQYLLEENIKNMSPDELLKIITSSNRIIFETEKYLNEALHFTVANGEEHPEPHLDSTSKMDENSQMLAIFQKSIAIRDQAEEALAAFEYKQHEKGFTYPA